MFPTNKETFWKPRQRYCSFSLILENGVNQWAEGAALGKQNEKKENKQEHNNGHCPPHFHVPQENKKVTRNHTFKCDCLDKRI